EEVGVSAGAVGAMPAGFAAGLGGEITHHERHTTGTLPRDHTCGVFDGGHQAWVAPADAVVAQQLEPRPLLGERFRFGQHPTVRDADRAVHGGRKWGRSRGAPDREGYEGRGRTDTQEHPIEVTAALPTCNKLG